MCGASHTHRLSRGHSRGGAEALVRAARLGRAAQANAWPRRAAPLRHRRRRRRRRRRPTSREAQADGVLLGSRSRHALSRHANAPSSPLPPWAPCERCAPGEFCPRHLPPRAHQCATHGSNRACDCLPSPVAAAAAAAGAALCPPRPTARMRMHALTAAASRRPAGGQRTGSERAADRQPTGSDGRAARNRKNHASFARVPKAADVCCMPASPL